MGVEDEYLYDEIEAVTLERVPEIRDAYFELGWDPIPYPDEAWIETLRTLPAEDERRLGSTILFENLFTPFLVSLFEDEERNAQRIGELSAWIETLALQEDARIRETVVGVCICEQMLSHHNPELIRRIFDAFGPITQGMCRAHAARLNLPAEVLQHVRGAT